MDITSYLLGKKAGGGGSVTLQTKQVEVTFNGSQNVTADAGYDGLSKVELTTNVQPDLESKSIIITENTTTTITPSQDKDGISSVSVVTNVPQGITPTGTINITENGTVDVTNYASANVNVAGSGGKTRPKTISFVQSTQTTLDVTNLDTTDITDFNEMFSQCSNLTTINGTENLNTINSSSFYRCFHNCPHLTRLDLSSWNSNASSYNVNQMFNMCSRLMFLDMRSFDFTKTQNYTSMFNNVPTNCEIIVADQTQKDFLIAYYVGRNIKTVAEYEAE